MKIKVAVTGVVNCASALVQGVEYYKNAKENSEGHGLMHVNFGGYHIRDIEFVAAFDVNKLKSGQDLSEAIFIEPNCCVRFVNMPKLGVKVLPGPIIDGVAEHMKDPFNVYNVDEDPVDVTDVLSALACP